MKPDDPRAYVFDAAVTTKSIATDMPIPISTQKELVSAGGRRPGRSTRARAASCCSRSDTRPARGDDARFTAAAPPPRPVEQVLHRLFAEFAGDENHPAHARAVRPAFELDRRMGEVLDCTTTGPRPADDVEAFRPQVGAAQRLIRTHGAGEKRPHSISRVSTMVSRSSVGDRLGDEACGLPPGRHPLQTCPAPRRGKCRRGD